MIFTLGVGESAASKIGRSQRKRHEIGDPGVEREIEVAIPRLLESIDLCLNLAHHQGLTLGLRPGAAPLVRLVQRRPQLQKTIIEAPRRVELVRVAVAIRGDIQLATLYVRSNRLRKIMKAHFRAPERVIREGEFGIAVDGPL